jgi:hypothetical protein
MVTAPMIRRGVRVMVPGVAADPVMDADPAGAEEPSDLGDRRAAGDFEDGECAAKEAGIVRRFQLGLKPVALSGRQVELAHRSTSTGSLYPPKIGGKFQLSTRLV